MAVAKLSSRGQLVVPKTIRKHLHLQKGDAVDFVIQDDGDVVVRPAVKDVHELEGALKRDRRPVSLEEMDAAVRERAAEGR